jgi:uncharacterized membrane protein YfcA
MTFSEIAFLVAVLAVGIASGATAAVVGFGVGSLLTPLLVTRVEPHVAVSLIAIPHALATGIRFVQHRRAIDYGLLVRFGIPSAIGSLLGATFQAALTSRLLVLVVGLLLIATGATNLVKAFRQWRPTLPIAFVLGAMSGFFGGVAGNQGGLRAASLSAFSLPPRTFLATSTAVALLIDLARTPVYVVRSADQLRTFAMIMVIAAVGCTVGTILGERLFLGMSPERYRIVVGITVGLVGLWLCIQASR